MSQQIFDAFTAANRAKLTEAVTKFGCTFDPKAVEIYYNIRGRVCGRARRIGTRFILQYNAEAVLNFNEDMTTNTIPHEIAHLVCFNQKHLGEGHDSGWKSVCRSLGGDDSRCHDYTLTPAKIKPINRFFYRLPSGEEVIVGPKHHKGLQTGKYRHLTSKATGQIIVASYWTGKVKNFQTQTVTQQPPQPGIPGLNIIKSDIPALPATSSKKEKAAIIYKANSHLERAHVIDLFVRHAGLTKAGAGTYYQNFKSGKY